MALPRIAVDGRLAAEPELRFGQSGKAVARLRVVASDRRLNQATGEWEDADTLWIDVTCFDKLAENVCESVVKGDLVIVTGRLRTEEWQDRDSSQKRSKIAMLADSVAASLQFRQIPHGSAQRSGSRPEGLRPGVTNPVQKAYGADPGGEEPPF
jgi:single-strand DNA-binding protein